VTIRNLRPSWRLSGPTFKRLMRTKVNGRARVIPCFLRFASCLVGALMLLSFPLQIRVHDFNEHFRNPRICQSIVRHTSVERGESSGVDCLIEVDALRMHVLLGEAQFKARPPRPQLVSFIPLTRLFLRFKLGPSPSSSPDPLI
jgi:hypothetical protein